LLGIGIFAARTVHDQVRDRPADCGAKSDRHTREFAFGCSCWLRGFPGIPLPE
jgi:hypothetical protein